ncbi:Phosphonoacetaldehyde hydrolase [Rubripirellula lacrimiformis]|uniref:phosphonoacetaldehyde hydrolase n=1 Tax=Rubripirellula lacrimiformis TaxID=1930273 RepID=A0A517NL61_9BACT|nr:phosphonoacetaldehyde hydrolase [Rubripirellula lacrimiformis]QDT07861.1 Phosphonoacetaldehyde hydrolase [Rubripirellula lacrimiformis]
MTQNFTHLRALVLDWAGTTIDHGSRAPAAVFQSVFASRGVDITIVEAREPMGRAKRDHILAIATMTRVAQAWQAEHGRPISDDDVDAIYDEFLPIQKSILGDHCEMIDGVVDAIDQCRSRGLKIGSSTGYTQELMQIVAPAARQQGYDPDVILCADDAPRGRPAPFLLFEAAKRLDVFPMHRIVKVDDTQVGIEAGRNAGCWTVGITRSGNCVGLSQQQWDELPLDQQQPKLAAAVQQLTTAGAHYTIESVALLVPVLNEIDARSQAGERPG